ncbi:NAD(P)H-hydrate dehydratase [Aliiroseovarius sp. YM-037]|uniref:NAD(P)H-hydrate dehydratase n=1 Tax=Aliiroseovarius sp. YM-037 TaxID=3341728 RepID=UPI003A8110C3
MTELLTAAQMRAIEQAAIESGEVTGLELMERAGRGVVEAVFEEWPELAKTSHRAVVLCGPGNNGGDGFVVARLLKEWGWEVEVFLYGDAEKLPPDARVNYGRWAEMGEVQPLCECLFRAEHPDYGSAYADLYVDALFGTGLTRQIDGEARNVLTHMSGRNGDNYVPYTVAIDAPSGLCLDSGFVLGFSDSYDFRGQTAVAALTVAFDSPKIGHLVGLGPSICGKVAIKDIGLMGWRCTLPLRGREDKPMRRGGILRPPRLAMCTLVGKEPLVSDVRYRWNPISRDTLGKLRFGSHKYSHGHALILSGPPGHTGAARLTARGALRIGAGLVTVGCPPDAQAECASQLTAIMLRQIGDTAALSAVLADDRINALCLGPGLGMDRARELVPVALGAPVAKSGRRVVLDADALSAFADDPNILFELLHKGCVLIPHAGEFARLFPDIAEKLNAPATKGPAYSKVDATREAAARAGCVVLFKGADTVIADADGRCSINSAHYDRSAPWLATAGSGDVLAGFITGLLARGFTPMQAAEAAAWLHVECALTFGPGLIAEDLPEQLPEVLRELGM